MSRRNQPFGMWLREHLGAVGLAAAVVGTIAFIAFAWFHQPTAEYVPPPIAETNTITPTPGVDIVSIVGDSYVDGSGMNTGKDTLWTSLLATQLPIAEDIHAVGGVGYVAQNPAIPDRTFVTLASQISPDAKVIVFLGSRNDSGLDPATITQSATAAYTAAHAIAPDAKLLVIGPVYTSAKPPVEFTSNRDAVQSAAAGAGATFVDPLAEGWFTEGNTALIGSDGVHPTDSGHEYLAEKIKPHIVALLG